MIKQVSEKSYLCRMIPHLLSKEAKILGITPKDKDAWHILKKRLREKLCLRYQKLPYSVLLQDLSFKKNKRSSKSQLRENSFEVLSDYYDHMGIISNLQNIPSQKRDWIDMRRSELLLKISKYERILSVNLGKANIKHFNKMPFVIDGHIYFSNIYLPKYRIAIEIERYKSTIDVNKAFNDSRRVDDFNSIGVTIIRLPEFQAANPAIIPRILKLKEY